LFDVANDASFASMLMDEASSMTSPNNRTTLGIAGERRKPKLAKISLIIRKGERRYRRCSYGSKKEKINKQESEDHRRDIRCH